MMRWRVWFDRLIVFVILLAAWQGGSLWLGNYWLSSPWAVATRFVASLFSGELDFHGGYTLNEAVGGCVVGGGAGGVHPLLIGRRPVNAGDPHPLIGGGRRRH